jgi:hypothetical protein
MQDTPGAPPKLPNERRKTVNTYAAFYKHQKIEVKAETTYAAQIASAKILGARKSYKVAVMLLENESGPVIHRADF